MRAYHFLRDDMTAGSGHEPAWTVGEERTYEGKIELCVSGYHSSPSWYAAIGYAPGNVACIVQATPIYCDTTKSVSRSRKLIAARNVEHELRLWACDCAERALLRKRERGWDPDKRSWDAIAVARRFAASEATAEDLDAARAAARAAAHAAWDAAGDAARDAAWAAAWAAAWGAWAAAWAASAAARDARAAESTWQADALNARLDALFVGAL